jgi:hypothetical protein
MDERAREERIVKDVEVRGDGRTREDEIRTRGFVEMEGTRR